MGRRMLTMVAAAGLTLAGCSTSDSASDGSNAVDETLAEALTVCEDAKTGDELWFSCAEALEAAQASDPDVQELLDKTVVWAKEVSPNIEDNPIADKAAAALDDLMAVVYPQ